MSLLELTKSFSSEQHDEALESWQWIGLDGKTPAAASLFGDLFFASTKGGWYLDIVGGSLQRCWSSVDEMHVAFASSTERERYLRESLATAAMDRGLALDGSSIYDFRVAPVLGGATTVENLSVVDFVVAVNIAGQIHEQVRRLRPGTTVPGVSIEQHPTPKPRKFWNRSR